MQPTVHGTLCKSDPLSRMYLLLEGVTCTTSDSNFDKACFNFGLSASFIRSSLSNNDICLVLSSYPNAVAIPLNCKQQSSFEITKLNHNRFSYDK